MRIFHTFQGACETDTFLYDDRSSELGMLPVQHILRNVPCNVFLASCFVGVLSEIFARFRKEASTVFTIPGIICLVPGSNIYYTMAAILEQNFNQAASVGTETLMMAGAIAAGLLIVGSLIRILRSVIRRTVNLKEKL